LVRFLREYTKKEKLRRESDPRLLPDLLMEPDVCQTYRLYFVASYLDKLGKMMCDRDGHLIFFTKEEEPKMLGAKTCPYCFNKSSAMDEGLDDYENNQTVEVSKQAVASHAKVVPNFVSVNRKRTKAKTVKYNPLHTIEGAGGQGRPKVDIFPCPYRFQAVTKSYKGGWEFDMRNGPDSKTEWFSGLTYEGPYRDDRKHGPNG